MREAELLAALSQSPYGLRIYMQEEMTTIRLTTEMGRGATLMEAALDLARKVLEGKRKFPYLRRIREALEKYDQHTSVLRI